MRQTLDPTAILALGRVIPTLELRELTQLAPLLAALRAAGLGVIEILKRTDCALEVLAEARRLQPDLVIGMGTICTVSDVAEAVEAGAAFLVTPGSTPRLLGALRDSGRPAFPGVGTASEALAALEAGFRVQKFFPAEAAGGTRYLAALAEPLPAVTFFPTGGITLASAPGYLALPNVASVGGSFLVPKRLLAEGDYAGLAAHVRAGLAALAGACPPGSK